MTAEYRNLLRQAIDQARRAQIQAQGGKIGLRRPPFDLERGQLLRAAGYTWRQIGSYFGCYPRVAQYWLDPVYRARDQERSRRYQERSRRYAAKAVVDSALCVATDCGEFPSSPSTVSA